MTVEQRDKQAEDDWEKFRVCDSGIYYGTKSMGKMIVPKEAFIEAYNRFIRGKYE